jgi:hypothetical protein
MRLTAPLLTAAAFVAMLSCHGQAWADDGKVPFSRDELLNGKRTTRAECLAIDTTVWVTVDGSSECIRYYMTRSDMALAATVHEAAVVLNPDYVESSPGQPGVIARGYDTITPDYETASAGRVGKKVGLPFIILARPGTLGSSGSELAVRHTVHEVHLVNLALGAITRKYGITKVDLLGQSGGSILIGALMAMRGDIGCASIGSGRLGLPPYAAGAQRVEDLGPKEALDDERYVGSIRRSPGLRAFVLSDPDDKFSAIAGQTMFVARAAAAGLPVAQLLTVAEPDEGGHHDVLAQAFLVLKECVAGTSDAAIADMVRHMAEANTQKWAQASKTASSAATAATASDRGR